MGHEHIDYAKYIMSLDEVLFHLDRYVIKQNCYNVVLQKPIISYDCGVEASLTHISLQKGMMQKLRLMETPIR